MRQVWPSTGALIDGRRSAVNSSAAAELDALNFFKGPWGPAGKPFVGGVPDERPIDDFYPSGTTKHDIEVWLGTLSESDRKRALDPFTAIARGRDGALEMIPYDRRYDCRRDSHPNDSRCIGTAGARASAATPGTPNCGSPEPLTWPFVRGPG
jgi:hypothetical protein